MNRPVRRTRWRTGALLGCLLGFVAAIYSQVEPRVNCPAGYVHTGASQGTDQFIYFSLARAIWRTGNGITYAYPYCLSGECPPVMLQIPLAVISWIARLVGLPIAFEVVRVIGAAFCGGLLWNLCCWLERNRRRRAWLFAALVLGGGFHVWARTYVAVSETGLGGLTYLFPDMAVLGGQAFKWLPYIAQNVIYPLEMAYHALVFGAIVALVSGRYPAALCLGATVWFSHPFSAVALSVVALPWHATNVILSAGRFRSRNVRFASAWAALIALGCAYYGWFLGLFPELADVSRQHHTVTGRPVSASEIALMLGPWMLGLVWSVATRTGRRLIWRRPMWRLFGILAIAQLCLLLQSVLAPDHAIQPFHFNRGYMHLGFAALTWRMLMRSRQPNVPLARWAKIAVVVAAFDQAAFFFVWFGDGVRVGFVQQHIAALAGKIPAQPAGQLILMEAEEMGPYIAGCTPHVPYLMGSTMVVPFVAERQEALSKALGRRDSSVANLGIRYAIAAPNGELCRSLEAEGWSRLAQQRDYALLVPPDLHVRM